MKRETLTKHQQALVNQTVKEAENYAKALYAGLNRMSSATQQDAVAGAYMGLIEAAKRFRKNVGQEFWNYASCYVKKYVLREIKELDNVGGVGGNCCQLGEWEDEDGECRIDMLTAATSLAVMAEEEKRAWELDEVKRRMARLTKRETEVIRMLFGFDGREMSVMEVAHACDIKPSTVREIKELAIRKMQD